MGILIRYKYHVTALLVLTAVLFSGPKTKVARVTEGPRDLPKISKRAQVEHSLELMPVTIAKRQDLRPYILGEVQRSLPRSQRHLAFTIARSVIVEANHHGMDPMFLLAVITTESSFNTKARGGHGEIGLMQILPSTAKWLAPDAGVALDKLNLEDPATNIRIGATYFAQLRKRFKGHGTRYVSAYNMGVTNVRRLLKVNVEPKEYSSKVLSNYQAFYKASAPKMVLPAGRSIASVK